MAAEAHEFSGLLRHADRMAKLNWPIDFARKIWLNGREVILVANGPGPKLAGEAVEIARRHEELSGLVSTGFCGALDPALKMCDIFVANEIVGPAPWSAADAPAVLASAQTGAEGPARTRGSAPPHAGILLSQDRVASSVDEKSALRRTGASAVDMEAAAVAQKARENQLPFCCIRVVSDTADQSFPLDFNQMRDANGRFSRAKILAAAFRRPALFPKLLKLNKTSKDAARALGDFLADTRF